MRNKGKEIFNGYKLNKKFTIVILLVLGICLLFFTVNSFYTTKSMIVSQSVQETRRWIEEDYASVQKMTELCSMSALIFMEDRELQDFLRNLKNGSSISSAEYFDFFRNHVNTMESMVNSNPYLYQIRIYAYNNSFPEMDPIIYHMDRMEDFPWAQTYESGTWQVDYPDYLLSKTDNHHLISLVSNMIDGRGDEVGVVEAVVSMEEMFPRIYGPTDYSWGCFVKDDGTIVSSGKDTVWESSKEDIVDALSPTTSWNYVYTTIDGHEVIIAQQYMEEFSGTYVCLYSLAQQSRQMFLQQAQNSLVIILVFLVMAVVIHITVKTLFKRFYVILGVVRKVQNGDLDERIPVSGKDEISEMGVQINEMLDNIQVLMKDKIDREVLVKNTEIKALQNQINAHFIYNVLESIKMMAEIDEEYEISDAITALGELLRYNLKWVSSTVTIREEISYIRNYIRLMNLRYDFTIILSVNIDEDIYDQRIPKMSLQPIVENAILHGIAQLGEDATIYIKSLTRGDEFAITITDSGIGMDEEHRILLEKKINGEIDDPDSKHGIGLKNVNYRIKMQFGEKYGLTVHSMEGCYTKITVHLPRYSEKKEDKNADLIDRGR